MKLLLDTHVLLWSLGNSPQLSNDVKSAITDRGNHVYVSSISILEIRIKQQVGKLDKIPDDLRGEILRVPFEILDFTGEHADAVLRLPYHHRDPFDWSLIAQAQRENMTLVTHDGHIQKYDVQILKV